MAVGVSIAVSALRRQIRCRALVLLAGVVTALLSCGVTSVSAQEVIEYYATDAVGSIRVVFDPSGTVKARSDYLPFGEEWQPTTPGGPLPTQRFTGQQRDAEEGHDNFNARNYHTRLGRMTTTDPAFAGLFEPQRWNRYAYAINNPLAYVDPDGRDPILNFTDSTTVVGTSGNSGVPFSWALVAGDYTINGIEAIPGWWWYGPSHGAIETWGTPEMEAWLASHRTDAGNQDADAAQGNAGGDNAVEGSEIPRCPNCIPYTGEPDEFVSEDDFVSNFINSGGLNPRSLFKTGASTIGKSVLNRAVPAAPLKLLHGPETLSKSSFEWWSKKSTHEIIDSLKAGSKYGALVAKTNGTIMNGNTRITILLERGVNVNVLPRVPHP